MAGVVHISEAEAARDFAAVMRRVRETGLVIVQSPDGSEAVIRACARAEYPKRTIAQAQEILRQREEEQALATGDPEFAEVMEEIHTKYNAPMDSSKWE